MIARVAATVTFVAALSVTPSIASAQLNGSLESGAAWATSAGPTRAAAVMLRPAIASPLGGVDLTTQGALLWFRVPERTVQWQSSGELVVPLVRQMQLGTGWDAAGESLPGGLGASALSLRARLFSEVRSGDIWLEGALGRTHKADSARGLASVAIGTRVDARRLRVTIGVDASRHGALAALYRDTILPPLPPPIPDTLPPTGPRIERIVVRSAQPPKQWTDGSILAELRFGRASLHADVVARVGDSQIARGVWLTAGGSLQLGNRIVLTGSMGRAPGRPELDIPPGPAGFVGLRVQSPRPATGPPVLPSPTGALLLTPEVGGVHIAITLPDASTVEIAGDFSDWRPHSLARNGNRWETLLPLKPGSYRFNIRVDGGAWTVPPGVTSLPDEFGGEAGILVVG